MTPSSFDGLVALSIIIKCKCKARHSTPRVYQILIRSKVWSEVNSMSTASKLCTGIQSPADVEDYFICRVCRTLVNTDEMVRHLKTCPYFRVDLERVE